MQIALQSDDLIIIGAGPIGLMCAYYAIVAGLKVTIITLPIPNAKTAGIAAGGMLAPAYEFFEKGNKIECEFALNARNEWNEFAFKTGFEIDNAALALANDNQDYAKLEKIFATAKDFNLNFEFVKVPDFINTKYALSMKSDALINPISASLFLFDFITKNCSKIIRDEIIDFDNDEIIGKNAIYKAKNIIIANGIEAKKFSSNFEILNKLNPVRGQTIEIDYKPNFIGSIRYQSTYLMARENKIIIGATSQEKNENWEINDEDGKLLLNNAIKIFPQLKDAKITRSFCGIRPKIENDLPNLGQINKNIHIAIGAYRNGWAFAPIMAKLLIDEITQKSPIPSFLLPISK